ncbi:unnamed protein product [Closterium sp. Naga37s-1]|nr:unnamed protein product [Closterium sp. Naga37s-1]
MRITLLAPINGAFTSLPAVTRRYLTRRASVMHRVLAFHTLGRKLSAAQLAQLPAGSLVLPSLLNYPSLSPSSATPSLSIPPPQNPPSRLR